MVPSLHSNMELNYHQFWLLDDIFSVNSGYLTIYSASISACPKICELLLSTIISKITWAASWAWRICLSLQKLISMSSSFLPTHTSLIRPVSNTCPNTQPTRLFEPHPATVPLRVSSSLYISLCLIPHPPHPPLGPLEARPALSLVPLHKLRHGPDNPSDSMMGGGTVARAAWLHNLICPSG